MLWFKGPLFYDYFLCSLDIFSGGLALGRASGHKSFLFLTTWILDEDPCAQTLFGKRWKK